MFGNILTGGIGCGKSTVASYLKLEGFSIIDADRISHCVLQENKHTIRESFGEDIIENGEVNRKKLGDIIFNDSKKKYHLESILHPLIRSEVAKESSRLEFSKKPYFIEIPLYFESSFKYEANFIICVYANKELQLQRIMKRNNFSELEALKRIDSQIDIEIKKSKSDFVIYNTSDLKQLEHNIRSFLESFMLHF